MNIRYSTALIGILLSSTALSAQNEVPLTPPNAKPGECYAKVVIPAEYKTVTEKVVTQEASESISIIPAKYDTIKEEIEVVPATKNLTAIPATYKEKIETITTKPAKKVWKTSLGKNALPINPTTISAIFSSGVDITKVRPGECFREYYLPAIYESVSEEVMIQDEHSSAEVIPTEFETVEKNVIIKAAHKEIVSEPATYEIIDEKVLVSPEKTMWKKGINPAQRVSGATGEIMCLVNVPAKYKTIKKKVIKTPASSKTIDVPAITKVIKTKKLKNEATVQYSPIEATYVTVEKMRLVKEAQFGWYNTDSAIDKDLQFSGQQICLSIEPAQTVEVTKIIVDKPASIKTQEIPAKYEMIETKEMTDEAKVIKTSIPAKYKTITKKIKSKDEQIGWKRILCQTNMSKDIIASIQASLNAKGYKAGEPDGLLGKGTRSAIDQFQREKNLATGGLTYETLNKLGIKLKHQ